jgi:hypothetical protein
LNLSFHFEHLKWQNKKKEYKYIVVSKTRPKFNQ